MINFISYYKSVISSIGCLRIIWEIPQQIRSSASCLNLSKTTSSLRASIISMPPIYTTLSLTPQFCETKFPINHKIFLMIWWLLAFSRILKVIGTPYLMKNCSCSFILNSDVINPSNQIALCWISGMGYVWHISTKKGTIFLSFLSKRRSLDEE